MAALDPMPLPTELAAPQPGDDAWLAQVVDYATNLADELGLDGAEAGTQLAEAAAAGEADYSMPERARRWTVTDNGSAEWALRHVAVADDELRTLRAQTVEWASRIGTWFDQAAKPLLATKGFMEAHLERYALQRREANPKAKTLSLPAGKVQTSYTAAKVEIADDDAVVAWAEQVGLADEVLRVKKEPKVSLLREHVTIGPWYVGVRVELSCGHSHAWADGPVEPPEAEADYGCTTCGPEVPLRVVVDVQVQAVYDVALYNEGPDDPWPSRRVPGTHVAAEKVTATVKAERP